MLLYKIHIENYRSIENITLNLDRYNVIVGKNSTGKSNILKAINMALGERLPRITKNDFFNQDDSRTINIELFFNNFTEKEIENITKEIKYPVKYNEIYYTLEQVKKELETKKRISFQIEISNSNIIKKIYIGDIYYKYFSNELKNAIISTIYVPSIRDHHQILRITEYSFFNKLLSKIYDNSDQNKKEELKELLKKATDKFKEIFEKYEQELDSISKSIVAHDGLTMSILPSNHREIYKKLTLLINDGIETELEFKGSGIQSVIIISLFKLYADLKISNVLLLIEEPESFLHPQANRHMAKILKDITKEGNIQLIITTHSPNYLQNTNLRNITILRKINNKTKINQIKGLDNEIKIKKELNASNLELFFADKVILVEGRTEEILLPIFAKNINQDFDFDRKNISIIEMGSKSNIIIFIELLDSFRIPWLALLDNDFVSMTESKGLLKKINNKFNYNINFNNIDKTGLIQKFKEKGIYVLESGEIENYYVKSWLYKILNEFIDDLDLDDTIKDNIKKKIYNLTDVIKKDELKKNIFTHYMLESNDMDLLNKVINIKIELAKLDLSDKKMGKKLEKIFSSLDLTKPRIAMKIIDYINIKEMSDTNRTYLTDFFTKIFAQ